MFQISNVDVLNGHGSASAPVKLRSVEGLRDGGLSAQTGVASIAFMSDDTKWRIVVVSFGSHPGQEPTACDFSGARNVEPPMSETMQDATLKTECSFQGFRMWNACYGLALAVVIVVRGRDTLSWPRQFARARRVN